MARLPNSSGPGGEVSAHTPRGRATQYTLMSGGVAVFVALLFLWHGAVVTFTGENLWLSFLPRLSRVIGAVVGRDSQPVPAGVDPVSVWIMFAVYLAVVLTVWIVLAVQVARRKKRRNDQLTGAKELTGRIHGQKTGGKNITTAQAPEPTGKPADEKESNRERNMPW